MLREVRRLQVGDWVMGADGKPRRVTGIGYWTRRTRFLEIDGAPDGVMFNSDLVEVAEARLAEQEAQS